MGLANSFFGTPHLADDFEGDLKPGGVSPTIPNVFSVQDTTELAAITPVPADKTSVYVEDELRWYHFDLQSTATPTSASPSVGDTVVLPDELTLVDEGRWLRNPEGGASVQALGSFSYNFSRNNRNATDIWLSREDGLPANQTPFVLPFDCELVAISAKNHTGVIETWGGEVHINADIVAGHPNPVNAVASITVTASDENYGLIVGSVILNAGDKIAVFMRGSKIDRPAVSLKINRR